ncbi:hypothetical protein DPMN_022065 [Dreissena polymorpha]|uniref:Uncharacterized protein n=1 Tax=Dreissena polymorpha TaxID=45954 RepID=A0A9D4MPC7_DREPO|nr:hypothetical protein DPMN_003271 [Dreissena polymorpha]KAH3897869.1 hypothetical protein DPMN_022065 [Dreissena polymorpha]
MQIALDLISILIIEAAKITLSIRDTFLGCPKVFLSVHRGLILISSSPVSDVHIIKLCISIETRIARLCEQNAELTSDAF